MTQPIVRFQRLPHGTGLPLPTYQSAQAAGVDLPAANNAWEPVTLDPGEIKVVPNGFNVAIPNGYEGQVRPRSGLARKSGISIVNAPGTIDADYRGEIQTILVNHGPLPVTINRGDRIAQLVIVPVAQAVMMEVPELDDTERGAGGFGSTGVR
jgi:dUTP pyrophosphatase